MGKHLFGTETPKVDMTAKDLTVTLCRHYQPPNRPPAGVFAAEIGSPDGRRRADALWMPLTTSGGTDLIGHEIKVSRSDVLVELEDPTKAEPWLQFCGHWWLVVAHPSLVEGLDIPPAWGIMAPPSGRRTRSMTIVRPAPQLHPKNPAPGLQRLLAWSFFRLNTALDEEKREHERYRDLYYRADEQRRQALAGTHQDPNAERVSSLLAKIRKASNGSPWREPADDDLIVQAIVNAAGVREATRNAARRLADVDRTLVDPFSFAREQIDAAVKILGAIDE